MHDTPLALRPLEAGDAQVGGPKDGQCESGESHYRDRPESVELTVVRRHVTYEIA